MQPKTHLGIDALFRFLALQVFIDQSILQISNQHISSVETNILSTELSTKCNFKQNQFIKEFLIRCFLDCYHVWESENGSQA